MVTFYNHRTFIENIYFYNLQENKILAIKNNFIFTICKKSSILQPSNFYEKHFIFINAKNEFLAMIKLLWKHFEKHLFLILQQMQF